MQTMTAQQPSLFGEFLDTLPPPSPATMQTVMVKQHPRRVRVATTLPYAKGSETSRAAAEAAQGSKEGQEARVLAVLRLLGPLTDEEIGARLAGEMQESSARRARIMLTRDGFIRGSGDTRKSSFGRNVTVWEAAK